MAEVFTNSPGENYEADKAAEEISNASRDKIDNADADAKKVYNETAKTPEEMQEQMGTAPKSKKKLKEKKVSVPKHLKILMTLFYIKSKLLPSLLSQIFLCQFYTFL